MKTFLSEIPQNIPFEDLLGLDPSLDSAVRDVAQSVGMPASNGHSSILETLAAVNVAQLIHDTDEKDAFKKGIIQGILIAAALPKLCNSFVNSNKQEGTPK